MAKGNNGISTLVRRRNRLLRTGFGLFTLYYGSSYLLSLIFSKPKKEKSLQWGKLGNQHDFISPLRRSHYFQRAKTLDDVLKEYYTLIDIHVTEVQEGKSPPYKASATFCVINWDLQKENPSTVPMFRDLRQQSDRCIDTQINFDLHEAVSKARKLDGAHAEKIGRPMGVIFHETRCGSTLSANLLASLSASTNVPTRVYSESPPPVTVLKTCRGGEQCSSSAHKQLVRDVFYMMGRLPPDERREESKPMDPPRVFFKFQSITSHHIRAFTEAFPEVPWIFLYRDSVEVMMSHLKNNQVMRTGHRPVCARSFNLSGHLQPVITNEIVSTQTPAKTVSDLDLHEYCAAHLAGLSLSAIKEHERTGRGRFVNYRQLPDIMWETILPRDFGITVTPKIRLGLQNIASVYSKGRGGLSNREWKEDSTHKQAAAGSKVMNAAKTYLDDVYSRMEQLSRP